MERMSAADYQAKVANKPKANKYGAKRTKFNGIWFDSKKEADFYAELLLRERLGEISDIQLQPQFKFHASGGVPITIKSKGFPNGRHVVARMDFRYFDNMAQKSVVVDVKGEDTPLSRHKRAHVEAEYGVTVEVI